ncbi:hypothetical protein Q4Q35_21420 [Flavivirga aquimarina]|uniref:Calcineurin-like phosphoesterase domain-containing protein n=1 Tax=Flavivirga aquimarina TaxID=2027862 RepID=A0ABT8WH75_9FLAO|nr:hypothetical protein [Flavivirga aquimarina]MDO5972369.1 hypothetical protein [Flavivirga aquimarina]
MNKVIIHISDLHIFLYENIDGEKSDLQFWISTNSNDDFISSYIKKINSAINNEYPNHEFYLIITGDLVNESDELEYTIAENFLKGLMDSLKIPIENAIYVVGDHDINRIHANLAAKRERENKKKSFELNEKYKFYKKFYNSFFGRAFNPKKLITDILAFDKQKLVIIAINSNSRIGAKGGKGFIPIVPLEKEIKTLNNKYKDYSKIAAFHHNLFSEYEDKEIGQWDNKENRIDLINLFAEYNFKLLLFGNEHTRCSGNSLNTYYSEAGSLTSKKPKGTFKAYEIVEKKEQLYFKNTIFENLDNNSINQTKGGVWAPVNPKIYEREEEIFPIFKIQTEDIIDQELVPKGVTSTEDIESSVEEINTSFVNKTESFYSKSLIKIVQNKNLYHSGHFHWSETSRAHNWIDISKLLGDKEDLLLCKESITDIIDKKKLNNRIDVIIGLGLEGNIISTRASVKYKKPYTFLPYSYRYNEHNYYEKKLNLPKTDNYNSVLIITDVVHDGRTIRELINFREKDFFNNVKSIIVISLFYTGSKNSLNNSILNSDSKLDNNLNVDYIEDRLEYYTVSELKVEPCPYKKITYREDCPIIKYKLGTINCFYDESKFLN